MKTDVVEIPRDGNGSCGNPADMEFVYEGTQRERFRNLADDKGFMCDR